MKTRRAYQQQAFWARKRLRRYMLAWLRQGGKTTTLAEQSLHEMAEHPGRLITFATASLALGGEMPDKEAKVWQQFLADMREWADRQKLQLAAGRLVHAEDSDSWKALPADIDTAALADLLEHSKFEVRLKHSHTVSSRLKVIAANVQTARGYSGTVKLDECAFVPDLRTLLAEIEPIFSTDPTFNFLMATTPPPDYAHYAYELLTAEDGRDEWPVNPEGNWFKNRAGVWVHRVTIDDAAAAGRLNYHPDTGEVITPDQAREASMDKDGWDRSNRLKRPTVGTSAISPLALDTAQRRGQALGCQASEWPVHHGGLPTGIFQAVNGTVSLGLDLGTTEKKTSNPTALAVAGKLGADFVIPATMWWKTADPNLTILRLVTVAEAMRAKGIKVLGLQVDATNERYFATLVRSALGRYFPVTLCVGSERIETAGEPLLLKAYKGNLLANAGESGKLLLPFHRYLYDDFMRVVKTAGSYDATVGPAGEHGDTFDAAALALHGLASGGPVEAIYPGRGDLSGGPARSKDPSWMDRAKDFFGLHYA